MAFSHNGSVIIYMDRGVVLSIYSISRLCMHTNRLLHRHVGGSFVSTYAYPILFSIPKVERGPGRIVRIFAVGAEEVEYWSRGTSVGRDFSPRGSGRRRFSSWMHGDEWARWGSPSRNGNPRGIWGRGRNARIECVCALCVHAVLRCAWLETRTGYIYGVRLPGRWRHARGICRRWRQRETAARGEMIKTNEAVLAIPEDSRCRLIRSTRR